MYQILNTLAFPPEIYGITFLASPNHLASQQLITRLSLSGYSVAALPNWNQYDNAKEYTGHF